MLFSGAPLTWQWRTPTRGLLICSGTRASTAHAEWGDQTAFDTMISSSERTATRNAGFDWIRMPMDYAQVTGQSGGTKTARLTAYLANVNRLVASGFAVSTGFFVDSATVYDGVNGTNWTEFCTDMATFAAMLAADHDPARKAFDPVNEPHDVSNYIPHTQRLNGMIRAANPEISLFTGSDSYQGWNAAINLDGTLFTDSRIGISYHFYPEPYTQQGMGGIGYHKSFQDLEWPPVGANKAAALAALETRMTALGVDIGDKPGLRSEVSSYYDTPKDAAWVAAQHAAVYSHFAGLGLAAKQMVCAEWSAVGNSKLTNGMPYSSRVSCLNSTRSGIEASGIYCHAFFQLFGYGGTDTDYNSGIVDPATFTFDAGLKAALVP